MPYPIPDKPWSADFAYFLVAVPADRGFIRALKGHYTELGSATFWGEEERDPDRFDAADRMLEAIDETWRLIEMGWPDLVLSYMDEIEPLLRQLAEATFCCDVLPGADTVVSSDESGLDSSATDQSTGTYPDSMTGPEFEAYLCNAATAMAEQIIRLPDQISAVASWTISGLITIILGATYGAYIAIAGGALALLTTGRLMSLLSALKDLTEGIRDNTEDPGSTAAQALEAVKDDLICAFLLADTADDARANVVSIFQSELSIGWANVLALFPIGTWAAKIFNHDAPEAPDSTCDCTGPASPDTEWYLLPDRGTVVSGNDDSYTFTVRMQVHPSDPTQSRLKVRWRHKTTGNPQGITITSITTSATPANTGSGYTWELESGIDYHTIYNSDTKPSIPADAGGLGIVDYPEARTIDVEITWEAYTP